MMIAIIGLGYVGLPLAVHLSKYDKVVGYDIHESRIHELKKGHDRTGEISDDVLKASTLTVTDKMQDIQDCTIYIVTVPTPIDEDNHPDLTLLENASEMIGGFLKPGDIVVFESTVYPGVTEDVCGVILEETSGLKSGVDFYLGYSPERINPGDKHNTLDVITKVVAGQTPNVTDTLATLYGRINGNRIYKAKSIKVAEAAKVIENTQRDINIAFINELTDIFHKLNISIYDVLEAAGTKWNFLPFTPGFVGGHCIGVDPYYLADCAKNLGHYPRIILSGRDINDAMAKTIAKRLKDYMKTLNIPKNPRLLVLGLTFKENVPDLRNTKIVDLIKSLTRWGCHVDVHDAKANHEEALRYYNISLLDFDHLKPHSFDGVILAVSHDVYTHMTLPQVTSLLKPHGFVADLKGLWRTWDFGSTPYWSL